MSAPANTSRTCQHLQTRPNMSAPPNTSRTCQHLQTRHEHASTCKHVMNMTAHANTSRTCQHMQTRNVHASTCINVTNMPAQTYTSLTYHHRRTYRHVINVTCLSAYANMSWMSRTYQHMQLRYIDKPYTQTICRPV